jgi:nucleotide-binding universal stress UspA family protein
MEDHLVVGIDGTSAGRAAIRWAIERAARLNLAVVLVHVLDDDWGVAGEQSLSELHPEVGDLVRGSLTFAHEAAPGVKVTTRVLTGDPMVELAEAGRDARMAVVGTHKTGFIHGQSFGSRSLQLAGTSFGSRGGVIVGVDDSLAGRAAVTFGATEAISARQPLTLIRGLDDGIRSPAAKGNSAAEARVAAEGSDTAAVELAKALGYIGVIRTRLIERPAAEALVDAASAASLLVVGSSRRRGAQLAALGPVCHDVLLNIASPTVIVHGEMAPDLIDASEGATTA